MSRVSWIVVVALWWLSTPAGLPSQEAAEPVKPAPIQETPSDGDRVAQLSQSIEKDRRRLAELEAKLEDPESEYGQADRAFKAISEELDSKKKKLGELEEPGKAEEASKLKEELEALGKKHELAEDRFEIAFEEQKALKEQMRLLEQKMAQDQQTMQRLSGDTEAAPAGVQPEDAAPPPAKESTGETTPPPVVVPGMVPGVPPTAPSSQPTQAAPTKDATSPPAEAKPVDQVLQKAKDELAQREQEARKITQDVEDVQGSVEAKTQEIENTRKLLETARKKADLAEQERAGLDEELQKKIDAGAPGAELTELQRQIRGAQERYRDAQKGAREYSKALDGLHTELDELRKQEYVVLGEKKQTDDELRKKEKEIASLENPFHWRNLLRWVISHGPPIALILVLMYAANWLSRLLSGRIVNFVAKAGTRGAQDERENRATTLVGVFHNTAYVAIVAGGAVMILQEVGVPVGPLVGGAAIAGLAVAFGAQRLIGDYFHGFVILLENQYMVNDVVRIAGIAGLVERITMRMTVLRDLEGCVHFVPHGEIKTVTNMTHGWSRALFTIQVGYGEDPDQVMEVLVDLGKELRRDPKFASLILADPEMLGLDELGDSAIVFKFFIKTRPLQQWTVKRELNRRIKKKFDELGIEIPFPHRTVYMRTESQEPKESA